MIKATIRGGLLCGVLAALCSAQTAILPPQIGTIRDSTGHTRRVFGSPGAFVVGPPEAVAPPDLRIPAHIRLLKSELILPLPGGREKRVPLPGPSGELQRMSDGWLYAAPFVIRLTADGARIFRLPAPEVAR